MPACGDAEAHNWTSSETPALEACAPKRRPMVGAYEPPVTFTLAAELGPRTVQTHKLPEPTLTAPAAGLILGTY